MSAPMRSSKTFWWRCLSLALVLTFNLGSLYAVACPILCSPQHCMQQSGGSTMPGMPDMPASQPCCPAHSRQKNDTPCGAPAHGCITHAQQAAFLSPVGIAAPPFHSLSIITPPQWVPFVNSVVSIVTYSALPPPGFSSGRAICQKESFLRI